MEFNSGDDLSSLKIIIEVILLQISRFESIRAVKLSYEWLIMATLLDPRSKGLARGEEVWTKPEVLLQQRGKDTPKQEPTQEESLLPSPLSSD